MIEWLNKITKRMNVVSRGGVSDGQFKHILTHEFLLIKAAFRSSKNKSPKLTIKICGKRPARSFTLQGPSRPTSRRTRRPGHSKIKMSLLSMTLTSTCRRTKGSRGRYVRRTTRLYSTRTVSPQMISNRARTSGATYGHPRQRACCWSQRRTRRNGCTSTRGCISMRSFPLLWEARRVP